MNSPDALTTTSSDGKRIRVIPASPPRNGYWEMRRKWIQWLMLALYVTIPWIRVNGHPILQLDIVHRRFSILGTLFFAHEVPNLVFVLISFLMAIALFTTIFGRVWCGWACPQTVFIDRIYRKIEQWIEGDHLAQRRLQIAPMDINKFLKRGLKFVSFAVISTLFGQIFLGYFVGPQEAFHYLLESPAGHPGAFLSVLIMSGIVLFDFGYFREQFCLVACPYGRFQSVMMDQGSLFLAYDEKRNDCINCNKCVAVCPTGIDVRHGLQFECIACTACADACDSVMKKIKKPEKLIGYGSQVSLQGKKTKIVRGRTAIYSSLLAISVFGLVWNLSARKLHQMEVIRAVDTPYQQVVDENGKTWVINHFKARFYNLDWESTRVDYQVSEKLEVVRAPGSVRPMIVESGKSVETQFFLKVPREAFKNGVAKTRINAIWDEGANLNDVEVTLVGPQ